MALPVILQDHKLPPRLQQELESKCRVVWRGDTKAYADVVAIFSYLHDPVDGALMDSLPSLRVITNFGAGYEHIDVKAAEDRNIPVGHTPNAVNAATADLGMSLLLASARNIVQGVARVRGKQPFDHNWFGVQVSGATLGIVGMGRIGQEVAQRASGFGMRVIYHNRSRVAPERESVLKASFVSSLHALLAEADFVMLCVNVTPQTTGLIGAAEFKAMKSSATLINIARGVVVDQKALLQALKERQIRAAALDVTHPEPLPPNHPLLAASLHDRLIITPHMGSATFVARQMMLQLALANLEAGLASKPLPHRATV